MIRPRLGIVRLLKLAVVMALMTAFPGFWPGAVATFAQEPAAAAIGGAPAGKDPGQPRSYAGRVIEKDTRKPIEGATVKVRRLRFPDPETGGRHTLQETTHRTDSEGAYRFTIPPEQLAEPRFGMIVEVKHPDYPPETDFHYDFSNSLRPGALGERASGTFDVELARGQAVTGEVVTPDGKPAAGVVVHSSSYFAPEAKPGHLVMASVEETRTDELGRFRVVMVTPGEGELSFYPEKFAVSTRRVKENRRGDLGRIVLREGIAIKGRVIDADGTALAGVVVNAKGYVEPPPEVRKPLLPGEDVDDSLTRSAITDARGEFALGPLPAATYRVRPVEFVNDPALGDLFRRLPAPFSVNKVTLQEGKTPEPIIIRAKPHVVVEARVVDSRGRPAIGENFQLYGQLRSQPLRDLIGIVTGRAESEDEGEDDFWSGTSWPDADGKMVWHAPRGLKGAQIPLMNFLSDERHALRHRTRKDQPLRCSGGLTLGLLNRDVDGIEIVRYSSPTVLVKVVGRDGSRPPGAVVTARYSGDRSLVSGLNEFTGGPPSDVRFAKQDDGRFRSMQMLPDQSVTFHATADNYQERTETLKLPEGAVKEMELILDRR